jgi:hypothetical protein
MAERKMPEGWHIVSLHYADPSRPARVGSRPSDAQIAGADAIRVSYKPHGATEPVAYRTIHGASSRQQIGDLINRVTKVVSPV